MADEKIVIDVEVKGNAADKIEQTASATENLKSQLRALTLELQNLEPGSERFNELTQRAGQLKDQIADTQAVIKATAGSPLENLGKGLQGVASIGIRGFQGLQSAQALFGSESKALEQTLVKLQAVAGLADAVESLGGLGDTITNIKAGFNSFFNAAKTGLQGIKGAVAATGIGLLLVAVGTLVAYWDDIKTLVSGVSAEQERLNALAQKNVESENAKMEALSSSDNILRMQGLSEKEILQLKVKQTDAQIKALEGAIEQGRITFKSQYEAEKRNREILKGMITFIEAPLLAVLKTVDAIAKFAGFDTDLANKLVNWTSGLLFDENEVKANYDKTYQEQVKTLNKLKNDKAGYELDIKKIDEDAAKERARLAKERLDKSKQDSSDRLAAQRELQDAQLELMEEGLDKELLRNKYKYERMIEDARIAGKLTKDLESAYSQEKLQQDQIIRDEEAKKNKERSDEKLKNQAAELAAMRQGDNEAYQADKELRDSEIDRMAEGLDKEKALREAAFQDELWQLQSFLDEGQITRDKYDAMIVDATKKRNADIAKLEKDKADEIKLAKIQELNDTVEIGNMGLSAIQGLADAAFLFKKNKLEKGSKEEEEAAKKQFKVNKALQLSSAVITGFQSVLSAFANGMKNPVPLLGPATAAVYAGIAAATSAANIAKIAATKFESGAQAPAPPGPTPAEPGSETTTANNLTAPVPPSISIQGGAMAGSQGAGVQLYGSRQTPVKAVVLESDITSTQNKLHTYQQMAEIGG